MLVSTLGVPEHFSEHFIVSKRLSNVLQNWQMLGIFLVAIFWVELFWHLKMRCDMPIPSSTSPILLDFTLCPPYSLFRKTIAMEFWQRWTYGHFQTRKFDEVWGGRLRKWFCKMFSESSPCLLGQHGSCSSAQLPVEHFTKPFPQPAAPDCTKKPLYFAALLMHGRGHRHGARLIVWSLPRALMEIAALIFHPYLPTIPDLVIRGFEWALWRHLILEVHHHSTTTQASINEPYRPDRLIFVFKTVGFQNTSQNSWKFWAVSTVPSVKRTVLGLKDTSQDWINNVLSLAIM